MNNSFWEILRYFGLALMVGGKAKSLDLAVSL